MATRLTPGKSESGKPTAKQVSAKKAEAKGSATSARPATEAKRRPPAATIRALEELKVGKLNRYADVDELS
jgi:hypothetical protein